ncbi:hypothetical protein BZG36_00106 [Bifiguratus adelaidae]|uniref:Uncharacterized protein n=1 Tax=Bifiguratus adelaidae TaxID=1938954 RepID=A0A261Y878_9FUNG|nr:hypothetical protein BZG36_00106 [Bifiguratus adelaidae]
MASSTTSRLTDSIPFNLDAVDLDKADNVELRTYIDKIYASLHNKDKDLTLAAEIGKLLLEENTRLKNQLAECGYKVSDETMTPPDSDRDNGDDVSVGSRSRLANSKILKRRSIRSLGQLSVATKDTTLIELMNNAFFGYDKRNDTAYAVLEQQHIELKRNYEIKKQQASEEQQSQQKTIQCLQRELCTLQAELQAATEQIATLEETNERLVKKHQAASSRSRQNDDDVRDYEQELASTTATLQQEIFNLSKDKEACCRENKILQQRLSNCIQELFQAQRASEAVHDLQLKFDRLFESYTVQEQKLVQCQSELERFERISRLLTEQGVSVRTPQTSQFASPLLRPSIHRAFWDGRSTRSEELNVKSTIPPETLTRIMQFLDTLPGTNENDPVTPWSVQHEPGWNGVEAHPTNMKTLPARILARIGRIAAAYLKWCQLIIVLLTAFALSLWEGPALLI